MDQDPWLGNFARLPTEIRSMIWSYSFNESGLLCGTIEENAIIMVNRRVSDEVLDYLYCGLDFYIYYPGMCDHGWEKEICSHPGKTSRGAMNKYSYHPLVCNHNWEKIICYHRRQSSKTPFHTMDLWDRNGSSTERISSEKIADCLNSPRLRSLYIHLYAPTNAAENVYLWYQVLLLVKLLINRDNSCRKNVEVIAHENESRKWLEEDDLPIIYPAGPSWWRERQIPLTGLFVFPFLQLRFNPLRCFRWYPRECTVQNQVSFHIKGRNLRNRDILRFHKPCISTTKDLENFIQEWSLWFDWKLDNLSGPCCTRLKLMRFCHWSRHYVRKTLNILKLIEQESETIQNCSKLRAVRHYRFKEALVERFFMFRHYHPFHEHNWPQSQYFKYCFDESDEEQPDRIMEEKWKTTRIRRLPQRGSDTYEKELGVLKYPGKETVLNEILGLLEKDEKQFIRIVGDEGPEDAYPHSLRKWWAKDPTKRALQLEQNDFSGVH